MDHLESAQRVAELANERVNLIRRLTEIDKEFHSLLQTPELTPATKDGLNGKSHHPVAQIAQPQRRGRGRPPGSKNKKGKGNSIVVVGKKADDKDRDGLKLPKLLTQIAAQAKRPLKMGDFVTMCHNAGYHSDAKDFPNMVYQALLKLVKRGVLSRDETTRDYTYVGEAA